MGNYHLLNGIINQHYRSAHAICWTLLHSLWEGLICALIAWGILTLTKTSHPSLRYSWLLTIFAFFIIGVTGTFLIEQNRQLANTPSSGIVSRAAVQQTGNTQANLSVQIIDALPAQLGNWLSGNASLIVFVWGIVICFKLMKLTFSLGYTSYVRRFHSKQPAAHWTAKISSWSYQLGIQRKVTLLESLHIRVPVVFGYLKPVIFVPLGLLSSLSAEQAEAILMHELAHIRRQDYFVNLLQYFIETLFFFNPALLWLSALIRDERETCCDELAIGETGNPKAFIAALIAFREYLSHSQSLSVGFLGHKGSLVNRAARIVYKRNKGLNGAEKSWLLLGCLTAIALLLLLNKPIVSQGRQRPQISRQVKPKNLAQINLQKTKHILSKPVAAINQPLQQSGNDKADTTTAKPWVTRQADADVAGDKERTRQIIAALLREHIVGDAASLDWFALDADQLMVNGQKQPESLHHTFTETFRIEKGHGLYYGPVKVTGTGSFFDQKDLQ